MKGNVLELVKNLFSSAKKHKVLLEETKAEALSPPKGIRSLGFSTPGHGIMPMTGTRPERRTNRNKYSKKAKLKRRQA